MRDFLLKSASLFKWLLIFLLLLFLSAYFILRGSLPEIDGTKTITLLDQSLKIERDAQGIPTIRAQNRSDTAFALGYVHAQERYFQMDLLRRKAAGELAGLLGNKLMARDKKIKIHRFKERAQSILRNLPKTHYRLIQAYTNGVNSGIETLSNDPYQYLLLGQFPRQWEAEDSLLCLFAMYLELNDEFGERETSMAIMRDTLPPQWFAFLNPKGGRWDAPLDAAEHGVFAGSLSIPEARLAETLFTPEDAQSMPKDQAYLQPDFFKLTSKNSGLLPGSNSMVIDASLTVSGSAMLANDMHLSLSLPNIWYRASWFLSDGRRISGVTLPGMPAMVAGSNEMLAWGFTNSYGDWDDIITLKTNADNTQYLTAEGWKDFSIFNHEINSNTGKADSHLSIETIWGPVIGKSRKGELLVHQWVAYAPQAANMNLLELEKAASVDDALAIVPTLGLPPQNIVLADKGGHIAWSLAGVIPVRSQTPSAGMTLANQGWHSYLAKEDYPVLLQPASHRIWTANNRLFSGKELSVTGFEGGDLGARAQQLRDNLQAKEQFLEKDLLNVQLDTRGIFLQRWKQLLRDTLEQANSSMRVNNPENLNKNKADKPANGAVSNNSKKDVLQIMADVLDSEEHLEAYPDSVSYGLVKAFREQVVNDAVGWIYDVLEKKEPELFKRSRIDQLIEYPAWELVSKRPEHLVPQAYNSWHEFLLAAATKAYNEVTNNGQALLAQQSWGQLHKVTIRHPLSNLIPGLGLVLDMPDSPLSGDRNMPKVSASNFGASMRMVVSPGHEKDGIMHMPGGQSSHPLSPYYSTGHQDWVDGNASSFLPGETNWVLELKSIQ